MIIGKTDYDRVNARNVELARQLSKINDILTEQELNKTPAVFVVDKIREVIRRQNKITSKINTYKYKFYVHYSIE